MLVGKTPHKGSVPCEEPEWDGWSDPLFTSALEVVQEVVGSDRGFEWDLKPLFRLQMGYLLLWSSIERYVSLRYGLGDEVMQKVRHLAKEPAFAEGLRKHVQEVREVCRADDPSQKAVCDPEKPAKALGYYYQVRSNSITPWESGPASVAFDGENYLVVWDRTADGVSWELYCARVSPSGDVLAPGVQQLTSGSGCWGDRPVGISFDGSEFLAVYRTTDTQIRGLRVSRSGTSLDGPTGFPITLDGKYPSVAFDGTNFFVVWHTAGLDYRAAAARPDLTRLSTKSGQCHRPGPGGSRAFAARQPAVTPRPVSVRQRATARNGTSKC